VSECINSANFVIGGQSFPPVVRADKLLAVCWARFVGESIDTRGNALLERTFEAS
jgi:hypothetical protein